jgi:hypothetical protein
MNIDSKIKQELESESAEIDRILAQEEGGLVPMFQSGFKGSMKRWFILINIVTFIIAAGTFWCGYNFFNAGTDQQVFWGILSLACLQMLSSTKQWIFSEMSRSGLVRELKRVELSVAELAEKVGN